MIAVAPTVTTNWPASNVARVRFATPPADGRVARRAIAAVAAEMGYRLEGAIGKPTRPGRYLVCIAPVTP